jgi:coenzyme F420-reducing hydrogenase beta subunit
MSIGKDGHVYPKVEESSCINCNLCVKTCPQNQEDLSRDPITAFAGWHKIQSEYLTSTSGGAATALAQTIISKGGIVFGCTSGSGISVKHIRISDLNDLYKLKGSKYVQSDIGDTYKQIKSDLKSGKLVLFIGSPCQVAGLKYYLQIGYDNLYCVDIICHGVPSQLQLKKHIAYLTGSHADSVQFRKGNDMGLRLYNKKNEQIYYSNVWVNKYQDSYYGSFISGYSYRESCYTCRYAKSSRVSDVTVGDFWGLSKEIKHDEVNGCSCILPITSKGLELVKNSNLRLVERPVNEAVVGNDQLRKPSNKNIRAKVFRGLFPIIGYEAAYKICEFDRILDFKLISPIRRRIRL